MAVRAARTIVLPAAALAITAVGVAELDGDWEGPGMEAVFVGIMDEDEAGGGGEATTKR